MDTNKLEWVELEQSTSHLSNLYDRLEAVRDMGYLGSHVNGMQYVSEPLRRELCRVIDALLDDGSIETRLSKAIECFDQIERSESGIPQGIRKEFSDLICSLSETVSVVGKMPTSGATRLTSHQEMRLTDRLFSLYTDISGGGLIF
jgi:hypothetical protein